MPGPIKPDEVEDPGIPEIVFTIINEIIQRQWDGHSARVKQEEVVERLVEAGFERAKIFEYRLLDVEGAYRAENWDVVFRSPDIYENYFEANYTFSKPRRK